MANKIPDDETVKKLVETVMTDGNMNKFEACRFVAGMFDGQTGFTILIKFEKY